LNLDKFVAMLSSLLLALGSLTVLTKALPRDQIPFGPDYHPYQAISNNPESSTFETAVLTQPAKVVSIESASTQLLLGKEDSGATTRPAESEPAPFAPVPAQSLPCIEPLYKEQLQILDGCNKAMFKRRSAVSINHCFNILGSFDPQGSVMVTQPALCPDGTYAKLIIYEGQDCSSMVINTQLHENDTGLCVGSLRWQWNLKANLASLKAVCKDSPEYNISLAKNATVSLFAASTKPIQSVNEGGCSGRYNNVSFPADTCQARQRSRVDRSNSDPGTS
jgi:hypothetical protein